MKNNRANQKDGCNVVIIAQGAGEIVLLVKLLDKHEDLRAIPI